MIQSAEQIAFAVILFGGAILTCLTVIWKAWPPLRRFIAGTEAMQELIGAQLKSNHGSSLVDKVDETLRLVHGHGDLLRAGAKRMEKIEYDQARHESEGHTP